MAIEDYYKPCTRKRTSYTTNVYGEEVKSYTDTTINGYSSGQPSSVQVFQGGKWVTQSQITFLTDDSDIKHDDLVVLESGDTYRVIGKRANGGNQDHHYEVLIERVDNID